jgi:ABC-type transporter Mla subunit MlaD
MAHDGKTQREGAKRTLGLAALSRPPVPKASNGAAKPPELPPIGIEPTLSAGTDFHGEPEPARRPAKRRPAGPARSHIAANDDVPSIGGLIFALQQKPSGQAFMLAAAASGGWLAIGALLAWGLLSPVIATAPSASAVFTSPMMVVVLATVGLPIALFWFLALLSWRAQELKLMSSAMTEVAVRLSEPDKSAEQSAASLGQAVRRQVSFMNEAISRALGRAGELEALVHNEVSALEKSYGENEHKIKGLIQELVGERHALVSTTDKVSETLKAMGSEVPNLIEKLSQQQIKLAKIIEGAGQNLVALESQLSTASGSLETSLSKRTLQLQAVLDDYTVALDATLASRAEALDVQLVERTRALDAAFAERLSLFDESLMRSTIAIDGAVSEKARALTHAMENHVKSLSDTLGRQASNLDESMMTGIAAVRRTSDSITRQSLQAIEGLSSRADMLKSVSENLVSQMSGVANRFDNQGNSMAKVTAALENTNTRLDQVMRNPHPQGGDGGPAELRARQLLDQLASGSAPHSQAALEEIERLQRQPDAQSRAVIAEIVRLRRLAEQQTSRALEDMRNKYSGVSPEISQHLGGIASRFNDSSDDLRARASRAAAELHREQERMRMEAERMPTAARESADAMRAAVTDQLRALEQLSSLSARERQDMAQAGGGAPGPVSLTAAYAGTQSSGQLVPAGDGGGGWSLGDLLDRASHEDDGSMRGGPAINIDVISRALDATTASAIWSRFRAGQRGIMVRSIYTAEGRATFDELSERYKVEPGFQRMVDRFLVDFEQMLRNVEQKDASGRAVHNHLISDSGRVYLFLAHASGRLR